MTRHSITPGQVWTDTAGQLRFDGEMVHIDRHAESRVQDFG